MREIKFRGKRLDNGAWVYGSLMQLEGSAYIYDYDIGDNGVSDVPQLSLIRWHADPVTVGQSTGLHDKNGAEIFEGDIVEAWSQGQRATCEVKWGIGRAGFCLYRAKNGLLWNLSGGGANGTEEVAEVIGNIHQHPHLLP